MDEPIISVSGLRGIIGVSLDPTIIARYVNAFTQQIDPGPIVVSRDGRDSGKMVELAVISSLLASGRDVLKAGIIATPTHGVLVKEVHAAGGIQITASHNPSEYNGLKLFGPQGGVLNAKAGERILDTYKNSEPDWKAYSAIGKISLVEKPSEAHLQRILKIIDVDLVRSKKFKVLLDSNHASGSVLGKELLEQLGCEATFIGEVPDGKFEHKPEPTEENLRSISAIAEKQSIDVTFCQDPDADRLAIIDENGKYIGEEYTLALCVDYILKKRSGPIVTNLSTSRMSHDIAKKHQLDSYQAKVGEANVIEVMIEKEAVFAGEGNGGPIDPQVGLVRDSFVGMALILASMAESGKTISELVNEIPKYEIFKTKIDCSREAISKVFVAIEESFSDFEIDRQDGIRLDFANSWLQIRASNTEPIVRIIAEAESLQLAKELCRKAEEVIQKNRE